jgi:hypothetical protein
MKSLLTFCVHFQVEYLVKQFAFFDGKLVQDALVFLLSISDSDVKKPQRELEFLALAREFLPSISPRPSRRITDHF